MAKFLAPAPFLLFASACGRSPSDELARLSAEFVNTTLAFSPTAATAAGLHVFQKQNLDEMLATCLSPTSPGSFALIRIFAAA
ncbi:MAG: hypothetical protein P4L56_30170 [Candidatus Sulfopaludibacter sp.]|nr:hypothetical protein [Candidatus Sulfopaludibacter sp.]